MVCGSLCRSPDSGNRAIGGSAGDDLLPQVRGLVAGHERVRTLERSRRGRRHAALSGAVGTMGSAPCGYRYIGRHTGTAMSGRTRAAVP
jgi:site-specific DNA recombinase